MELSRIPPRTPILDMLKRYLPIILTATVCLYGFAPAMAQSSGTTPSGAWEGTAESPAGPFRITLELERTENGWRGAFSIPSERVEVPISEIRLRADSIFVPLAPRRELRGRVAADSIAGVLDVEGHHMPMTLARAGSPAAQRLAAEVAAVADEARSEPLVATAEGETATVDPEALDRLIAAANAAHSHALVVLKDGELVGAWHASGERRKIELMSATKSVVNLAVGRLVMTGALASIDEPVHRYYPAWSEGDKSHITIRHLLNHTSGLDSPRPTTPIYESDDFVRFALDADLLSEPGTELAYNNNAANLLAGVVGRAAGERMDLFLGSDLFAKLGITDFGWSLDSAGNPHGMSGLQMYAEDVATLGQLVLQRGEWDGEQLIDLEWFDESLQPGSELSDGVGLLWWLIREDDEVVGYRADGYLGQYLVIYPEEGLVAVRLVANSAGYDAETDGFREFEALVRDLELSPDPHPDSR